MTHVYRYYWPLAVIGSVLIWQVTANYYIAGLYFCSAWLLALAIDAVTYYLDKVVGAIKETASKASPEPY